MEVFLPRVLRPNDIKNSTDESVLFFVGLYSPSVLTERKKQFA